MNGAGLLESSQGGLVSPAYLEQLQNSNTPYQII